MIGLPKPVDGSPYRVRERYALAGGWRCRVFEAGNGPPLLLLPSPLIHGTAYRDLIRTLAASFQVTAIEMPGSGKSARLPRPWSVDAYVAWLFRAAKDLGLRKFLLLGHSNSGAVAFRFSQKYPEFLQGMVLADTIGFDPSRSLARTLLARLATAFRELHFTALTLGDLLQNLFVHTRNFLHQAVLAAKLKLRGERQIPVRALIAWGALDRTMRVSSLGPLANCFTKKVVCLQPRGDHDWLVEKADDFSAEVLRFSMTLGRSKLEPAV